MSDNRVIDVPPEPTPPSTTPTLNSTEPNESLLGVNPTEPSPAEPVPFDAEKLTLPEGFTPTEALSKFTEFAATKNLPMDVAQELVNMYTAEVKSQADANQTFWSSKQSEWLAEVKADLELGGDKLPGILQTVARVLDNPELSDPGFRAALDFSGMGSNPAVVRTLSRWATALTEGGTVSGEPAARNPNGQLANARPSPAESLYPGGPHTGGPKLGA